MKKTVIAGLGVCAIAMAFAAKDPVIMTVNGVDVPKSEFEYLYNKNSQQQINPQTLDEYVEMFKLYKMKVADARAEGIDTMASFLKETEQYRHDLAAPYLADSLYINKLAREAYDRSQQEAEAYHIMLFKSRGNPMDNVALRQRMDSIRQVLLNGGDFADLAARFSQDRGSSRSGGRMGWITTNKYPEAFEEVCFALPEGEISQVVESPVGYHVLKGGKKRPARGNVNVTHILKLTQNKDAAGVAKAKAEIDSLYIEVMANPYSFEDLAKKYSDDRGSARNGGKLPPFGAGEMVAEFDSVAFALKDGEISKPFKTAYGYHIIRRYNGEAVPEFDKVKPQLVAKITNPQDPRYRKVRDHQTATLAKKHKGSLNMKTLEALRQDVIQNGIDSLMSVKWSQGANGAMPLFTVAGKATPVSELMSGVVISIPPSDFALSELNERVDRLYNKALVEAEEEALLRTQPDYANLLREYVDGSLLYEVSVRKVWDKAAKDTEGLDKFFQANRGNYSWSEPRAKGFLVQAANDSVAELVRARAAQVAPDSLVQVIRKEFKGQAGIDRVLVSKGTNAMVDNLMFGGKPVEPQSSKYKVYFMINPRLITEPEEVNDVKGLVTSDYQNEFQAAWENELRQRYPVTVNEKVLRSVKKTK